VGRIREKATVPSSDVAAGRKFLSIRANVWGEQKELRWEQLGETPQKKTDKGKNRDGGQKKGRKNFRGNCAVVEGNRSCTGGQPRGGEENKKESWDGVEPPPLSSLKRRDVNMRRKLKPRVVSCEGGA